MSAVRRPRRLARRFQSGSSRLQETARLTPIKLSATINLDSLTTVDMTLPETDPVLNLHEFVEVYGPNGSLGIFRVAERERRFKKSTTYRLNHAIDMFNDLCIQTGNNDFSGSVHDALVEILEDQFDTLGGDPFWQLGTVECSDDYSFSNNYNNAYDELKKIADENKDYYYSFDFSTFPWTLNFLHKSNTVNSELRLNKNVVEPEITYSDNEQCTKLYLQLDSTNDESVEEEDRGVETEVYTDADGIAQWGIIEKTATIATEEVDDVQEWVDKYFSEHSAPELTITITGEDFSRITGEPMDSLKIGGVCRAIFREYNYVFHERVVSIKYPDLVRTPEHFEASFVNKRKTASTSISHVKEVTEKTVSDVTQSTQKLKKLQYDFYSPDGMYHSQMYMDAYRFTLLFEKTGVNDLGEDETLYTKINQTAEAVTIEAHRASQSEGELASRLSVTADAIAAEVTRATTAEGTLSGNLTVEAGRISQIVTAVGADGQVTAGSIVLAINQSTGQSEAKIDAGHVYIGNEKSTTVINGKLNASDVTAEYLNSKIAKIPTLTGIAGSFRGNVSASGIIANDGLYLGQQSLATAIKGVQVVPDGNNYILQYQEFGSSGWHNASTFSRATSLSGAWSGNTYTVTASPQGNHVSEVFSETHGAGLVSDPDYTVDAFSSTHQAGVIVSSSPGNWSMRFSIDASDVYDDGSPISGRNAGRKGSSYDYYFTIVRGDGTTVQLEIDCSGIYSDARSGYTQGIFSLADITLQGDSDSVYKEVSAGGTNYYEAGSAITVYDRGSGVTVYDAGTAYEAYSKGAAQTAYKGNGGEVYPITSTTYFTHYGSGRHYDVNGKFLGNHDWYYSGSGTAYYRVGNKTYARGDEITYYPAIYYGPITPVTNGRTLYPATNGRSITPISGSAKMLAATTRYKAGSRVTDTYYTKS